MPAYAKYSLLMNKCGLKCVDSIFLKWLIVGGICFLTDYVLFLSLYNMTSIGRGVSLSNGISMGSATLLNYYLHRNWTFKSSKPKRVTFNQYIFNFFVLWCMSTLLLKFLLTMGAAPSYAKLIISIATVPISYIILRFYVFNSAK